MFSQRRNLRLYYAYIFTSNLAFTRAIFVIYLAQSGFSNQQIGVLQSTLFLANFVSEIPTGYLADKIGRKASVFLGLLMLSIGNRLVLVFQGRYVPTVIAFAIEGIGFAFISGANTALLYDTLVIEGRSDDYLRFSTRAHILSAVALGIGMLLGGYMQEKSWALVYNSYSVVLLIAAACILFVREKAHQLPPADRIETESGPKDVLSWVLVSKQLRIMLIFSLAYAIYESLNTPYYIFGQQLFEFYQVPPRHIGTIYAFVQIISGVSYLAANRLRDRLSLEQLIYLIVSSSIVIVSLNITSVFGIALAAFLVITIVPEAMYLLAENYLQQRLPSKYRATLLSTHTFIQSCGIAASYITWGYLLDRFSVPVAFSLTAVFPLVSLIMFALYFRFEKRHRVSTAVNR